MKQAKTKKTLVLSGIFGYHSLLSRKCLECEAELGLSGATLNGRICSMCAKKDSDVFSLIRSAIGALRTLGFKFESMWLNISADTLCSGVTEPIDTVTFQVELNFKKAYPAEVFKGLPKNFERKSCNLPSSKDVCSLIFDGSPLLLDLPVGLYTMLDEEPYEQYYKQISREICLKRNAMFKERSQQLLNWAMKVKNSDNIHVWRLAGYFD